MRKKSEYRRRLEGMDRVRFGVSLTKKTNQILDEYCLREHRSKSNMIEVMILAYKEIHETKF